MNSLSWLLFWADVLPQLSHWLSFVAFVALMVCLALGGFYLSCKAQTNEGWSQDPDTGKWGEQRYYTNEAKAARSFWLAPWLAPLFFILWGAAFLVPEKETFYLIAGSEAGERALQIPEFGKVRAVINKYLDDQLPDEKSEKKEGEDK